MGHKKNRVECPAADPQLVERIADFMVSNRQIGIEDARKFAEALINSGVIVAEQWPDSGATDAEGRDA